MEKFELVIVLVNTGFTGLVMDAAREQGAHGGTVVHARGTGNKEMEKRFGLIITPENERKKAAQSNGRLFAMRISSAPRHRFQW